MLGYPCYHSIVFFSNIRDCEMWNEALDSKFFGKGPRFTRADWDQLLGNYRAVSADPPAVAFAEDLVEAYPEAKVILVERDIDAWYASFERTVIEAVWSKVMNWTAEVDPFFVGRMRDTHRRWTVGWMGARNKEEMKRNAKDKYREHYALVRRVTPKERLLEFKLSDGWAPLCKFLNNPVPDVPFPRVHDEKALWERVSIIAKRGLWNFAKRLFIFLLPLCIAVALGWQLYHR